jgi:hypothetical protein
MKHRDDWVKSRDLSRGLRMKYEALFLILERLRVEHHIAWDEENRFVQIGSYDPHDRRRFRWIMDAQEPRSQFEPHLERGKIYPIRDFRIDVVGTWVAAGAAEWVKPAVQPEKGEASCI